jgi:hypothetical protein
MDGQIEGGAIDGWSGGDAHGFPVVEGGCCWAIRSGGKCPLDHQRRSIARPLLGRCSELRTRHEEVRRGRRAVRRGEGEREREDYHRLCEALIRVLRMVPLTREGRSEGVRKQDLLATKKCISRWAKTKGTPHTPHPHFVPPDRHRHIVQLGKIGPCSHRLIRQILLFDCCQSVFWDRAWPCGDACRIGRVKAVSSISLPPSLFSLPPFHTHLLSLPSGLSKRCPPRSLSDYHTLLAWGSQGLVPVADVWGQLPSLSSGSTRGGLCRQDDAYSPCTFPGLFP